LSEIIARSSLFPGQAGELELIINALYDGTFICNKEGVILMVNVAYERITGVKTEELLHRNVRDLVDEGVISESITLKVLEQGKPVTIRQQFKSGKEVLISGSPVWVNGETKFVVTNVRDMTELNRVQKELAESKALNEKYISELTALREKDRIVYHSKVMEETITLSKQLAAFDSTILILGESGVGKELIANLIHKCSYRSREKFVKVNCGAIPEELLESELFGYESGAFTGANSKGKPGLFEIANNGTIFLDEIGELSLPLQVKLLRVLQESELMRVGGVEPIKVNFRLVAATNKNLEEMVRQKKFREDLYYRLHIVPIVIPSLRERVEDIAPLVFHFFSALNRKYGMNKTFLPGVIKRLENHLWPGNVRELENMVERLYVTVQSSVIEESHLPSHFLQEKNKHSEFSLQHHVEKVEKQLILDAIKKHQTTRKAALELGINQSTLVRKMQKYRISPLS